MLQGAKTRRLNLTHLHYNLLGKDSSGEGEIRTRKGTADCARCKSPVAGIAVSATGKAFSGRSRPLCAWPKYAHYKGQGDPEKAEYCDCRR